MFDYEIVLGFDQLVFKFVWWNLDFN
jgi:hypothetical protein